MKKINISTIDQAVKAIQTENKRTIRIGIVDIEIDLDMTFDKRSEVVEMVSDAVVGENGYHPEIEDVVLFTTILQRRSNANIPTKTDNGVSVFDMDKIYKWYLACRSQWDDIKKSDVMADIICAVDSAIAHKLRIIENKNPILDFVNAIADMSDKLASNKDEIEAIADKFNAVPETYAVPATTILNSIPSAEEDTEKKDDDEEELTVSYDSEGNMIF